MRLGGLKTASIPLNLVDELWTERPKPLIKPLIALRDDEVGESGDSKLDRVRKEIAKKKCSAVLISDLAEVACKRFAILVRLLYSIIKYLGLTNCRNTADIPFNPVFFAVAFITADDAHLFIDERKLEDADGALKKHLRSYTIHSYDDILKFLEGFHKEQMQKKGRSHKVCSFVSTLLHRLHVYAGVRTGLVKLRMGKRFRRRARTCGPLAGAANEGDQECGRIEWNARLPCE